MYSMMNNAVAYTAPADIPHTPNAPKNSITISDVYSMSKSRQRRHLLIAIGLVCFGMILNE